jgi:hypothetical protein
MKKTLQDQYLLIKEGKGHKGVFLADAKREFPQYVRNAATYDEAIASLKTKSVISENFIGFESIVGHEPKKKESYETAFESFLAEAKKKQEEDEKAELKKTSKQVEEDLGKNFDYSDDKNPDNLIFDQIMMGYYAEMKDPKNANKTMQQLKDIVLKNLAKDPIHYTKEGQFGVKDLGYTTEHPGLGTPKEPKGKYASSGYGNLNEDKHQEIEEDLEDNEKDEYAKTKEELRNAFRMRLSTKSKDKENDSPEESKLREVIREIIGTELEEMRHLGGMFQSKLGDNKKERKEGEPKHKNVYLHPKFIKKLEQNKDIRFITNNEGTKLLIKKNTTINPPITTNSREDISTPPEIITFLNNGENQEPIIGGGKFPGLNNEMFEYVGLKNVFVGGTPGNRTVRITILNPDVKEIQKEDTMESLQESVEKELAAINKEAEHEILSSKLSKIQDLIDKKQSQLGKLDEDEDMKALTDDKKVKEISKDIKALEKAKAKLEKMMSKSKGKKKEVIDEDAPIEEAELNEAPPSKDAEQLDKTFKTLTPSSEELLKNFQDLSKINLEEEPEESEEY